MNIKIFNIVLLSMLLHLSTLFAIEKVGTTSFQFLKKYPDARATSMGEAYSAVAKNSDALFWNPARLTNVDGYDFSASYMDYWQDAAHFSFTAATSIKDVGSVGIFGIFADMGDIYETRVDKLGFVDGSFNPGLTGSVLNPNSFVIGASFARDVTDKFSFGITAKYGHEDLVLKSTGTYMFDAGINFRTGYKSLEIAAVIRHFGPEVKFVEEGFPLPQTFNIGISGYLIGRDNFLINSSQDHNVLFAFDIIQPRDFDQQYNVGVEWAYNEMFFLRGGYKMNYDSDGLTLGVGINFKSYRIDYSFNDSGEYLNSIQRFTFGLSL